MKQNDIDMLIKNELKSGTARRKIHEDLVEKGVESALALKFLDRYPEPDQQKRYKIINVALATFFVLGPILSLSGNPDGSLEMKKLWPGAIMLLVAIGIYRSWRKSYIVAAVFGFLGSLPGLVNIIGYIVEGRILPGFPMDLIIIAIGGGIASGAIFLYKKLFPSVLVPRGKAHIIG